jgi:hypothetical protein
LSLTGDTHHSPVPGIIVKITPVQNHNSVNIFKDTPDPNTKNQPEELIPSNEPWEKGSEANLKYYTRWKQKVPDSALNGEVNGQINEKDNDMIHLSSSPQGPTPEDIHEVNELNIFLECLLSKHSQ